MVNGSRFGVQEVRMLGVSSERAHSLANMTPWEGGSGFGVWGVRFRAQGSGFRVQGSGLERVWKGLRVQSSVFIRAGSRLGG